MYLKTLAAGIAGGALLATMPVGAAFAVEDFYKGRNIQMIIGYTTGGGYDVYGRTVGRHMGRHIPGNPTFVPQNMPGAGSLTSVNHLYNAAPKDGSAIGTFGRGIQMEPLFGNDAAKFDAIKFNWIGSANNEVSVCVAWHTSGVTSFDEVRQRELIVGGTGPGADTDLFPQVMNNVLGAQFKLISGYPGGNDVSLAMERGEVQGRCGWSWSSVVSTRPQWLEQKQINILTQMSTSKHPNLPDVPLVMDLAETDQQRQILSLVFARQTMGRPFAAPPGVPADRVKALQDAFWATMKDETFLAEADKAQLEIEPVSGPDIQALVEDIYATPTEVVQATIKAME